jgi:hypothetical protein
LQPVGAAKHEIITEAFSARNLSVDRALLIEHLHNR